MNHILSLAFYQKTFIHDKQIQQDNKINKKHTNPQHFHIPIMNLLKTKSGNIPTHNSLMIVKHLKITQPKEVKHLYNKKLQRTKERN